MNLFQYNRGHFFGTVLPGAFLLICILLIKPSIIQFLNCSAILNSGNHDLLLIAAGFIISYVTGVGLRLLNPEWLESLALLFRAPFLLFRSLFNKILFKGKRYMHFNDAMIIYKQRFPYSNWFFNKLLPASRDRYKNFYEKIYKEDFKDRGELLNKTYINYCKSFIYDNSKGLGDEVMYNEGLIRFLCGITYSLLIVLIIISFDYHTFKQLFWIVLTVFLLFLFRLRGIRTKEVISVLDGFYILNTK